MINGNSANFGRRLAKLKNSKLGAPANLADFRIPKIVVHEGDDVSQIIKDMEARRNPTAGKPSCGSDQHHCASDHFSAEREAELGGRLKRGGRNAIWRLTTGLG
jgi:hypothetical protein